MQIFRLLLQTLCYVILNNVCDKNNRSGYLRFCSILEHVDLPVAFEYITKVSNLQIIVSMKELFC